mmetsp:Transcript_46643/g.56464  ORF Transcript_46643/g.56464 Transcript_46643/m.56464 type:complete len:257 (-) Transcript_46643:307-1077(-)
MSRVGIKKVVIPLGGRTTPYVRSMKTTLFDKTQVLYENGMICDGTKALGLKVLNRVKIGYEHSSSVGIRTFVSILVDIHTKQNDIHPIYFLKEQYTFRSEKELGRVAAFNVTLKHLLPYSMFLFHIAHNPHRQVQCFLHLFNATAPLTSGLLICLFETILKTLFQRITQKTSRNIFCSFARSSCLLRIPTYIRLTLDNLTFRAGIGRRRLILPAVKESAYLMHPTFTVVTLYPGLFCETIIFQLLQVLLLSLAPII